MDRGMISSNRRQLSFVLPVTLHETGNLNWRNSADSTAPVRLNLLLSSFLSRFNLDHLGRFIIICPSEQIRFIRELVISHTHDSRFVVMNELEVCPEIALAVDPQSGELRGWYVQQVLKLAAAEIIDTEFYLTLDSDIVCLKSFDFDSLIIDGRAYANIETTRDYLRLYLPEFARIEHGVKASRMQFSAHILKYQRAQNLDGTYFGETPVVMHTESVREMGEHIQKSFSRKWTALLAINKGWTEQNLYFQFLELSNRFKSYYRAVGCNHVLHLEKSVWQASQNYRQKREYGLNHFRIDGPEEGIFVAIQSWLNTNDWLPQTGFRTLPDFYEALRRELTSPPLGLKPEQD